MDEILHHLGCEKPVNNGIFTISTGAGFLPPTVSVSPKTWMFLLENHAGLL